MAEVVHTDYKTALVKTKEFSDRAEAAAIQAEEIATGVDQPNGLASLDENGKLKESQRPTAAEIGGIAATEKGVANGVATLDSNGLLNQKPNIVVGSIDEMKDLSGKEGETVVVKSYHLTGKSGGGVFYYSSDNPYTTVDDSGIVFYANNDNTGASGYWIRSYDSYVNVKWFGAKGDGVTDDTDAINAAALFVDRNGRGIVYFPEGHYIVNEGSITVYQNIRYVGADKRATHIESTNGTTPIFAAENIGIGGGRTQRFTIENMKITGNASITTSILDLRGGSYFKIQEVEVRANNVPTPGPAKCIDNSRGGALFNGYNYLIDVICFYGSYGFYGEVNQLVVIGGAYNVHTNYGIYAFNSANVFITGHEASNCDVGGVYFDGTGLDVSGQWSEFNGNSVSGVYNPNDVYTTPTSKRINVRSSRLQISTVGAFHGEEIRSGQEFYNTITGSGDVAIQNILPNGSFKNLNSDNEPQGYTGWVNSTYATFQQITGSDLPNGRYTTGIRATFISGVPKLYRTYKVQEGETYTFNGWVRMSPGLGNCRVGIFNTSNFSNGAYHIIQQAPKGTWYFVQTQWTIPSGVTEIAVGCSQFYNGTSGVDYADFTGWSLYKGSHGFFDSESVITSDGGEIWGREFKIGGRRHTFGTEAPSTPGGFNWLAGDIIYNTTPDYGKPVMWQCRTTGDPGSWDALYTNRIIEVSLAPSSVAANTSEEQTFTVSGLNTNNVVVSINPPTGTPNGIIIGGVRVTSTNTIGIRFGNLTGAALTPASGTYKLIVTNR